MRITFLVPNLHLSGGTRIVETYAEGLAGLGHSVSIVSASSVGLIERAWRIVSGGTPENSNLRHPKVQFIEARRVGPEVVRLLPEADLLIATWWETVEWVVNAPSSKGVKVHLVQDHEVFPYLPVDRATAILHLPIHKIAVSKWLFDLMREKYQSQSVRLVSNPVDLREFSQKPRSMSVVPTVGTLFSTTPRKNSARTLEAVQFARRSMPQIRLIGYGASALPRSTPKNLFDKFEVCPGRRRIAEIYSAADFWLFTSDSEGFGLPILEAMAAGTPVIATPAGAAPQLVDDTTGALVGHDSAEVSEAILNLYARGHAAWAEMSANCRRVAEDNDRPQAVSKFERTLTELLRDQRGEVEC